jgi:SAM-dependent methyltransferase
MLDRTAHFVGDIPAHYEYGLGPHLFADYGADLARRVAAAKPRRVLEIAAGTGIVTRLLRDALPPSAYLVASDLNSPMLGIAREKSADTEQVEFQQARPERQLRANSYKSGPVRPLKGLRNRSAFKG